MWTVLRLAAARAALVPGALAFSSATSRVAFVRRVPVCPRFYSQSRSFTAGRAFAAKAASAKKAPAKKKTAGRKKRKAVVKKAKPVKRARKVLTPEEKLKKEVRELKKVALLQEPAKLPDRSWLVYVSSQTKGQKVGPEGIAGGMSALSQSFKLLSSGELQRLEETASRNKLSNNASYKSWVESHPAEDVADANKARIRLKRISSSKKSIIHDDRQPKRPSSSYSLYCKSRWGSGDFEGQSIGDVAKTLSREWKGLSASDRKPYEDLGKADIDRYEKEMMNVLGRTIRKSASP